MQSKEELRQRRKRRRRDCVCHPNNMAFVHLHLHTEYTLLDGVCRVSEIPEAVKSAGQSAVAITDRGVLSGAVPFYRACVDAGIHPIIGCELSVLPRKIDVAGLLFAGQAAKYVLLVRDAEGYRNLLAVVSAQGGTDGSFVDRETLEAHAEGLFALFDGAPFLADGDDARVREELVWLRKTFGERGYAEVCRCGRRGDAASGEGLLRLLREAGVPPVATNDVLYLRAAEADVQRLLSAIREGVTLQDRPGAEGFSRYLRTEDEMREAFRDLPEAVDNTVKIAKQCRFAFDFGREHLPVYPLPDGERADAYLARLSRKGCAKRVRAGAIPGGMAYDERLETELRTIREMGFSDYFLIVWDFVRFARQAGIPVGPGRGSGVGSLVAYCIGITEIDPIAHGLLFERFLNPERMNMPDFDIDFSDERRGEVTAYVTEKYGRDRVSQILTFGTMACRQAMWDAGRAMGLPRDRVGELLRLIPRTNSLRLGELVAKLPELREKCETDETARTLFGYAMQLEGRLRNTMTHPAGLVIADKPLCEYVPLSHGDAGAVTQYTKDEIALLGLLKIDFLGSRYLTVLQEAETAVRAEDPDFRLADVPTDDEKTYALLRSGHSLGLFQLESEGMRGLLQRVRPTCFADLMLVISLYRPGPSLSIETFLRNRAHPEKTVYLVPELEPILRETYGCLLFQEQVMQICRNLAGFTLGHADVLIHAMKSKRMDEMEGEEQAFLDGCVRNGVARDKASELFSTLREFAKYAFNKSHAAAYALFAYRTAYLKAHYPQHYLCALLNAGGGTDKVRAYASECAGLGICILPPDVNRSLAEFSAEGRDIRYGLAAVKGVGDLFARRLVEEREAEGPFRSPEDLLTRVCAFAPPKSVHALTLAGALDGFGFGRGGLLSQIEWGLSQLADLRAHNLVGQVGMFDEPGEEAVAIHLELPKEERMTLSEKLAGEKEQTGLYFSGHPLDRFAGLREKTGAQTVSEMREKLESGNLRDGAFCRLLCAVTELRRRQTRKGETMAFLSAEDETGDVRVTVFPSAYARFGDALVPGTALLLDGTVELSENGENGGDGSSANAELKMILKNISNPETISGGKRAILNAEKSASASLYLRVTAENRPALDAALAEARKYPGDCRVLAYFAEERKLRAVKGLFCRLDGELLAMLQNLLGGENVAVKDAKAGGRNA